MRNAVVLTTLFLATALCFGQTKTTENNKANVPSQKPSVEKEKTMKIKLHEIELYSKDVNQSLLFYKDIVGLKINLAQPDLNVMNTGFPYLDFNTSSHYPGKLSISFLVSDINEYYKQIKAKGIKVSEIADAHLGMKVFSFEDPDGNRIEIQMITDKSPDWLKDKMK